MFLFSDTHFFLHFKHAQELPWQELLTADPITLVVGRTVQKEIEKHKFETRGRRQDRARDIATKLGKIALSDESITLRSAKPGVFLALQSQWPPGWQPPVELDRTWGDDMIIADVLAFRVGNPLADVAILTGDPGLMAKARAFAIQVLSLAGRNWELPTERSQADKDNEKLRRENEELKRIGPLIGCRLEYGQDDIEVIILELKRYPQIEVHQRAVLRAELIDKHPRMAAFDVAPATGVLSKLAEWRPPSQDEIDKYHANYEAWLRDFDGFIDQIELALRRSSVSTDVALSLTNDGNSPADAVRLTIEMTSDYLLSEIDNDHDDREEDNDKTVVDLQPPEQTLARFRAPPKPPAPVRVMKSPSLPVATSTARLLGHPSLIDKLNQVGSASRAIADLSRISDLARYSDPLHGIRASMIGTDYGRLLATQNISPIIPTALRLPEPRDPNDFYWLRTPNRYAVSRWQLECQEFQHRMEPESFSIRITADVSENLPKQGALRIELFARNLREPFRKNYPVQITVTEGDLIATIRDLMP